jgi:hypothetical protein
MNNEIVPVILGLALGCALGRMRSWRVALVLATMLGVLATIITGEFRLSWGFVLLDVPLVAAAAAAGCLAIRGGARMSRRV